MSAFESDYFRLRSVAERTLAKAAPIAEVAAVHEWLAQQYEALAQKASEDANLPVHDL